MVSEGHSRPPQFLRRVQNRPSLRRRSRLHAIIRVAVVVGIVVVGGLGMNLAYRQARTLPVLSLQRVILRQVPAELIEPVRGKLRPQYGRNLLALDLPRLRQSIEALPGVRRAAVRRLLPDGLVVSIEPRQPRAILQIADRSYAIDSEGVVLSGPFARSKRMILIRLAGEQIEARPGQRLTELPAQGASVKSALAIIDWLEGSGVDLVRPVDHFRLDASGVVLVLRQPTLEIILGDERALASKIAAVRTLLVTDPPSAPSSIDTRYRDMLVVRTLDRLGR
ncbi:MAG: cell division protein FtsQ/DivIB [Acidobacteriota bacterium]